MALIACACIWLKYIVLPHEVVIPLEERFVTASSQPSAKDPPATVVSGVTYVDRKLFLGTLTYHCVALYDLRE